MRLAKYADDKSALIDYIRKFKNLESEETAQTENAMKEIDSDGISPSSSFSAEPTPVTSLNSDNPKPLNLEKVPSDTNVANYPKSPTGKTTRSKVEKEKDRDSGPKSKIGAFISSVSSRFKPTSSSYTITNTGEPGAPVLDLRN